MGLNQKGNTAGIAIATLVVGILLGAGIGYAMGNSSDEDSGSTSSSTPTTETKAADTRVALNAALREHVALAGGTLRAVFDESPNAEAAVAELDKNSVEAAGIVGSVYGDEAEDQFLSLWRKHIEFFANYTVAAREGNKQDMDQALADLEGYATDAGAFFENANPNLPASAVMPLLKEHRDLVIAAVNAHGAGDYKESYAKEAEAYDQIGTVADAIAEAVVAQMPDNFR